MNWRILRAGLLAIGLFACGGYVGDAVAGGLPPTVEIRFAGNPDDEGGPYWRPPGDSDSSSLADDGYYADFSRQQEEGIEIRVNAVDPDSPAGITGVTLIWRGSPDPSGTPPVLDRFDFPPAFGQSGWTIRTDETPGFPPTEEGIYYSFDVVAKDVAGDSTTVVWEKTAPHSSPSNPLRSRRFVQLNCDPVEITYKPYYLRIGSYGQIDDVDRDTKDRFRHDSGPDNGFFDTGALRPELPTNTIEQRYCTQFIGYWFDADSCVQNTTIENIYYHIWMSSNTNNMGPDVGWGKTRLHLSTGPRIDVWELPLDRRSTYIWQDAPQTDPVTSNNYGLLTGCLDAEDTAFSDNSIYEMFFMVNHFIQNPSCITSRQVPSFVIFNVPDSTALALMDSDSDGLMDDQELYVRFTSPFLSDTDNDLWTDAVEVQGGTDPNNPLSKPTQPPKPPPPYEPDGGGGEFTKWESGSAATELSLAGAWPNPTVKELAVAFTLPDDAPAQLEAFDLAGRRVALRNVGSLGAGNHVVQLGKGDALGAGVYWVRLTRGDRTLTTRAVIVQ